MEEAVAQLQRAMARLQDNIERVIVGKRRVAELAVAALLCDGHILIEDVPGIGKTTLARTIAKSGFVADLRAFVAGLWASWRRRVAHKSALPATANPAATGEDDARTLTLREMYRGLLWEGRRAGSSKKEGETPHEYAARLGHAMPPAAQDMHVLTEEYSQERYGPHPVPPPRYRSSTRYGGASAATSPPTAGPLSPFLDQRSIAGCIPCRKPLPIFRTH